MNSWLIVFPGFLLAYLLGSIPTAVWVGKWFYGKDIRNEGSGNAGATNTIRVLGIKAGIPVILVDVFKGYLAVFLMRYFLPEGVEADSGFILKSSPDSWRLSATHYLYLPVSEEVKG